MAAVFTELQKQKLMHMFELLDVDGNGVLEYDDFRMVVDTMAEERGWERNNRRYISLVASNKRLWTMISRNIDIDSDGSITLMEWLAFHIKAFIEDPMTKGFDPKFSAALRGTATFFCDMLDSDGDGKVCIDDYIAFCAAYNVSEAKARLSFGLFDRDGSGDITVQEVEEMVKEFYLSDDPMAPGNLFFGNL
jgi:Ca2+-binding EF-hand superfamily protein